MFVAPPTKLEETNSPPGRLPVGGVAKFPSHADQVSVLFRFVIGYLLHLFQFLLVVFLQQEVDLH